ncbi:MAG: DUF2399 domain-containing protein [Acidimicrobiales bacterium]
MGSPSPTRSSVGSARGRGACRRPTDALARAEAAGVRLRPLRGTVPAARWDGELAPAITAAGVEVEEELVLDLLVRDMSAG